MCILDGMVHACMSCIALQGSHTGSASRLLAEHLAKAPQRQAADRTRVRQFLCTRLQLPVGSCAVNTSHSSLSLNMWPALRCTHVLPIQKPGEQLQAHTSRSVQACTSSCWPRHSVGYGQCRTKGAGGLCSLPPSAPHTSPCVCHPKSGCQASQSALQHSGQETGSRSAHLSDETLCSSALGQAASCPLVCASC